ncbi:tail fiber domain-containing protein [Photobacterium halotolerans]|uniref:tail fiber domain-containing protein n=1 Tax=Photobacterium halotolerans TaxID=265726 RepID=UPI0006851C1D|nr:tail fiber domain-containing protein [Photobacterium halotolerans]
MKIFTYTTLFTILFSSFSFASSTCCPFSDMNLKNNIKDISYAEAELILSLSSKTYNWKESGKKDMGLIAQDVQEYYPYIVHDKDGLKTVDYDKLIAPMLVILKNQEERIKTLESTKKISQH